MAYARIIQSPCATNARRRIAMMDSTMHNTIAAPKNSRSAYTIQPSPAGHGYHSVIQSPEIAATSPLTTRTRPACRCQFR